MNKGLRNTEEGVTNSNGGEENFTEGEMQKMRPRWRRGIQTHGMTMTRARGRAEDKSDEL